MAEIVQSTMLVKLEGIQRELYNIAFCTCNNLHDCLTEMALDVSMSNVIGEGRFAESAEPK